MTKSKPRTLILGFDGGDPEVFSAFDMPFLESIQAGAVQLDIKEDLLTRGWSEIITGCTAEYTGGLYFRPQPLGTKTPILKDRISLRDMLADEKVVPLWRMLNERGISFGMMGVPTTSPAPQVDGFVVSGGGGGLGSIKGIPEGFCHPPRIAPVLDGLGYEFDVRLATMPEKSFTEFVRRVEEVVDSNIRAAIALNADFKTDVLFLCLRPTTGLQYLARYDIEQARNSARTGAPPSQNAAMLRLHYAFLDDQIRRIFEAFGPDRFILTSDHGTAPYLKRTNLNAILQERGFQVPRARTVSGLKSVLRRVKPMVPRALTARYGKTVRQTLTGMELNFDHTRTLAFGSHHVRGVYINDSERFGGPVGPEQLEMLTERICTVLNNESRLAAEGFRAIPFRRHFGETSKSWQLPDVFVDCPDSCFFVGTGPLLEVNPNYRETPQDLSFVHNPFSGTKGARPLMCVDSTTAAYRQASDPADLRLVYYLLDRIYST